MAERHATGWAKREMERTIAEGPPLAETLRAQRDRATDVLRDFVEAWWQTEFPEGFDHEPFDAVAGNAMALLGDEIARG